MTQSTKVEYLEELIYENKENFKNFIRKRSINEVVIAKSKAMVYYRQISGDGLIKYSLYPGFSIMDWFHDDYLIKTNIELDSSYGEDLYYVFCYYFKKLVQEVEDERNKNIS